MDTGYGIRQQQRCSVMRYVAVDSLNRLFHANLIVLIYSRMKIISLIPASRGDTDHYLHGLALFFSVHYSLARSSFE